MAGIPATGPRAALERVMRRVAHVYWRHTRGITLGVRALVIDPENRIFLVKHSYVRGWYLPGGGVEPGETVIDALIRELREEANIEPTKSAADAARRIPERARVAARPRGAVPGA